MVCARDIACYSLLLRKLRLILIILVLRPGGQYYRLVGTRKVVGDKINDQSGCVDIRSCRIRCVSALIVIYNIAGRFQSEFVTSSAIFCVSIDQRTNIFMWPSLQRLHSVACRPYVCLFHAFLFIRNQKAVETSVFCVDDLVTSNYWDLKVNGKRKRKSRFSTYLRQKWIDLGPTSFQTHPGCWSLRGAYLINTLQQPKCFAFEIFVCLSDCLSHAVDLFETAMSQKLQIWRGDNTGQQ